MERYRGEWLAIEVTRYEDSELVEGVLIDHDKDPDKLLERLKLSHGRRIYITYAGPLIEEDQAVIL